ncbi:MAG: nucleotidyltransferase domain-containing protein [Ruminococcus sp.]|nr:nucleotidyltransferase domain-containing protein [Ruminococcus sp.]
MCAETKKYDVSKVILFGSRATHQEKRDLDLAVYGCADFPEFSFSMQEEVWTLLKMDLIDMNETVSEELISEIERDGVVIYEKV